MKKRFLFFFIGATVLSILLIVTLATGFWKKFFNSKTTEYTQARIVIPQDINPYLGSELVGQILLDDSLNTKVSMENGESVIAVLNIESDELLAEEQFIAFINSTDTERRIYITYIYFDDKTRSYIRLWNEPTAATRPETITLFREDLTGDRNNCIIVTGMNNRNEHTMTIFRRNLSKTDRGFNKIAELQADGSIKIQEAKRSLAYQQGITSGQSYNIAAYGHDTSSSNILDQIETIYSFNPNNERYEQTGVSRIPGSQVEQQLLKELLSGTKGVFENFIHDLWYYVSPQGTIDSRQYLYFDPAGREIVFFGDETQQVFNWQTSTATRYGIYIRSQNVSIITLLRFIDIELESLDSIKLRVTEDVQLKIAVNTNWDGSYRRARAANLQETRTAVKPGIDALYDSSWGRLQFYKNGEYTINASDQQNISTGSSAAKKGHYVFFYINEKELVELRQDVSNEQPQEDQARRMIYKIDTAANGSINLSRVRLGTSGIQDLYEPPITLTPVDQTTP
jgi:hypothetical protein